jgi:hypothetical protein
MVRSYPNTVRIDYPILLPFVSGVSIPVFVFDGFRHAVSVDN